jgi:beta-galactosidase
MRDHPEYSGQFLWSGIDYLGEAGRWPSIGAGSGLLLTTSLPRARAFERQSWWADPATAPMVRIARRVQAARRGPVDPGYASPTSNNQAATTAPNAPLDPTTRFGQPLLLDWSPKDQSAHTENIEIYTNAEEVELFLNNKSLGTQKLHPDASPITYQVPFEPGTLKAIARINNKTVAEDELRTAGKPTRLILTIGLQAAQLTNKPTHETTPALATDWNDVAYITATLVDANNTVIPDSETSIHFSTTGPAKIIAVDNGNLLDHDPFQSPEPEQTRKLYEGHAIAILRATSPSGTITLTATTEGLPPAAITFKAIPAPPTSGERSF